jgi:hypothetical protein
MLPSDHVAMELITVLIDEDADVGLRAAVVIQCRTLRSQAAAELRRALGLPMTRTPTHMPRRSEARTPTKNDEAPAAVTVEAR